MTRNRIVDEFIYEETMAHAERTCADLEGYPHDEVARVLAEGLRRAAQSLRLAVVADADPSILARIKSRLDTLMRQAPNVVAACEAKPASQRPTAPPPSSLDPRALFERAPSSERPTVRPPSVEASAEGASPARVPAARSGVVSKVDGAHGGASGPGRRNAG
jgi:hypothetical protein